MFGGKTKTKISKYGKKKTRGGVGEEDIEHHFGSYDFKDKDIYCFSDLEGNMPNEIKALMFDKAGNNIDYSPKILKENGCVIVFTGDLIDRGAYSIRNLLNMYNLKNNNYENVVLICGNRDLNKIRMYHECCIPYIENNIFIPTNKDTSISYIIELLNSMPDNCNPFKHQAHEIAKNINIVGIVNIHDKYKNQPNIINRQKIDDNFIELYRNDIFRIKDIYINTLGSPNQIKFFRDEFNVLFRNDDGTDIFKFTETDFDNDMFIKGGDDDKDARYKLLLKFVAMMNMVMGKEWDEGVLPTVLQKYNGLYIKYLTNCHIIAEFTKEDRLYFVSHSGIPYYNDASNKDNSRFYIPTTIGSKNIPDNSTNTELIIAINKAFKKFIANIDYGSKEYRKYVAMAAGCGDIDIVDDEGYTSEASPIVSSLLIKDKYDKRNISLKSLITKDTRTITRVYNIYGHLPTGLLPTVNKIEEETEDEIKKIRLVSYHIGLDISKAENGSGISNKTSYVYLRFNKSNDIDDSFVGKTVSNLPYHTVKLKEDSELDPITLEQVAVENNTTTIKYDTLKRQLIDNYSNDKQKAIYNSNPLTLFTVDRKIYYGISGWNIVKYTKNFSSSQDGAGKKKIYAKSVKRFMNGKRQMVIYLGKRGGEYLKVKGEYISLAKYIKTVNKKK